MRVIQDRTRSAIRQSIGRPLGLIVGAATTTTDTTSLIDTTYLTGGDDEHNNKQVIIYDAAGSIVDGEIRRVTDFASSTNDATVTAFTASITALDKYELWPRPFLIEDVNDVINRAIDDVSRKCLQPKQTSGNFTNGTDLEYAWLSGFEGVHTVEYVRSVGVEHLLSDCETAWTAGASVTATADSTYERMGTYCSKLAVGAGAAAGAVLGYDTIGAVDISDCDRVEFDMYSSIALTAGYLDFVLDDTAACVSPVESIDVPAMSAATWYRHSLALANPHSDTAIISLGLVNTTDVGACTIYIDNVRAVKNGSKDWVELNPQQWGLVRDSTNYLKFTTSGKRVVGSNNEIRINGYQLPSRMTADTDTCEVDPEFVIEWCLAYLLLYHAKSRQIDIDGRLELGKAHLQMAEMKKRQISMNYSADTRFI